MKSLNTLLEGILSSDFDSSVCVVDAYEMFCLTKIPMLDPFNTRISRKFMSHKPATPPRHCEKNRFGQGYYMRYIWDWIASLPIDALNDDIQPLFDAEFPKSGLKLDKYQMGPNHWSIGILAPHRPEWEETFRIKILK